MKETLTIHHLHLQIGLWTPDFDDPLHAYCTTECGALIEQFIQISVEPDVSKIHSYSKHNIFHKYCTNISTERTKKNKRVEVQTRCGICSQSLIANKGTVRLEG